MAKYEQFTNNGNSTLNGGITDVAASLVVASAATFPTDGNFRLLIDSEILLVTAVSGTTFTVTRGAEGTTGAAHSNGATVRLILTAAVMSQIRPVVIRKTGDESVTSSTTLQDDDHLVFPIGANEIWHVRYALLYSASTAGDCKINVTVPSGGAYRLGILGLDASASGATGAFGTTTMTEVSGSNIRGGSGFSALAIFEGVIVNGATPGAVTLQFAQGTSDGTATTLLANSSLVAHRIA